jgi:hypothetical protein
VLTYSIGVRPGTYKVTASFEGCCGYVGSPSESVEFTVADDAVAPTGTLAIESMTGDPDYTTSRQVTLSHPASDNASVTGMAVSNDGVNWDHGAYTSGRTWFLPASNGTHSVYVKWYDPALNESAVVTDTIVLDSEAPFVTGPGQEFVEGSGVIDGKVAVEVPWSADDSISGVADFDLAQRTDSGAWRIVSSSGAGVGSAADETSVTRNLKPAHAYTFRVRAADRASNTTPWVSGVKSTIKLWQEANSKIRYAGTWRSASNTAFWGRGARKATAYGASASLTFTGRSFAWVARTGRDRGEAIVFIDGRQVKTVDLHSSTTRNKRVVFAQSWDDALPRTIKIVVVGTPSRPAVEIDAFLTSG